MRIKVTKEDIENGEPCDSQRCPIALALKRAFNSEYAHVDGFSVSVETKKGCDTENFDAPWEVANFVQEFDYGAKVEPFEFELPYEVKAQKSETVVP